MKNNIYNYFIYYRMIINGTEQSCGDLIISTNTKIEDLTTTKDMCCWLNDIRTQICKEITAVLNVSNDYRIITNDNIIISNYKFIN
jgi:hypothetical protein